MSPADGSPDGLDETALRIGLAWRDLRRGAGMAGFGRFVVGDGPDALELGQLDALEVVVHFGRVRMAQLAEAMRVDPSTATRAVDRLVRSGYAVRCTDPDDARAVLVAPTPQGEAVSAEAGSRRRAAVSAVMAAFDESERVQLADLLERLVAEVDRFVSEPGAQTP